jgi:origin recognition complex subunit 6
MSNIEQSLSLLLPSLSDHLPPELIALSNSLLAQSRNKAGNLKSEEEIARPYACCEIACKRLGAKLKLPALHARPPCAPRVYKKLLTFLEQALPAKLPAKPTQDDPKKAKDVSSARSTPKKAATARSSQSTPRATPKKKSTAFAGEIGLSRASLQENNDDDGAPAWVMPLIRRLCQTFSTPLLAPHVYTGLCVVLSLANLEYSQGDEDHTYRNDVAGLTLALFFMVLSRMQRGKVSRESYLADCNSACAVAKGQDIDTGITKQHVDDWIKQISSEEWASGQEWWSSVPEGVFDRVGKPPAEELEEDHDVELVSRKKRRVREKETEQDPEGTLLPGLGTMMQESIDWLSEDRRAEYLDWRAGIAKRLDRMDKGVGRTRTKVKASKAS